MAYGNAAYRLDTYPEYAEQSARSEVRAIRTGANQEKSPMSFGMVLGMALAVIIVAGALFCFVRIALVSEAYSIMIESDALSSQIAEARSTGVSLEMEQSVLSNPSAIAASAKKLGMSAPAEVGSIALEPDVVAVNGEGELSLSETVKNVVETQA